MGTRQQRGRGQKRRSVMRSTRSLRLAAARCNAWALASIDIAGCPISRGRRSLSSVMVSEKSASSDSAISDAVKSRTRGERLAIGAHGLSQMAARLASGKLCQPAYSRANGFSVTWQPSVTRARALKPNHCPRTCITQLSAKFLRSPTKTSTILTRNQYQETTQTNEPTNQGWHLVSLALTAKYRASVQENRHARSSFGVPSPRVSKPTTQTQGRVGRISRSAHGTMAGERGL